MTVLARVQHPAASRGRNSSGVFDLSRVRDDVLDFLEKRRDRDGSCGAYRMALGGRCDLYSSCDAAILRTVMGEDLMTVFSEAQCAEWCAHINSFAQQDFGAPRDGSYGDTMGHSPLHANGMVIGALGVLGGRQAYPMRLYGEFDRANSVGPWLGSLDWSNAWRASHLFWGGVHCFSFSSRADAAWLEATFTWLEANLEPATGWWRKGVAPSDRHQSLGGAVHLLPLFEHHGRAFPFPERLIDSVLALQLPDGRWLEPQTDLDRQHVMHYLELDALYALALMHKFSPDYRRDDILDAARRYGNLVRRYYAAHAKSLYALHPHAVLAAIGVFGGLQQLLPEEFSDHVTWTDIFSDRRFYRTREVESL